MILDHMGKEVEGLWFQGLGVKLQRWAPDRAPHGHQKGLKHVSGSTLPVEQKHAFLERLASGSPVVEICRELGLNRASIYYARNADPEFGAAWESCLSINMDAIRDEVLRKALVASGRIVRDFVVDEFGEPVLDDDFEMVTVERLTDYDARVLVKLMDRTLPSADGVPKIAIQNNVGVTGHSVVEGPPLDVEAILAEYEEA